MGVEKEKQEKLTVIYARCSTAKQKENLERQKDRLRKHAEAKGYKYVLIDEIDAEISELKVGQSPIKPGDLINWFQGGRVRRGRVVKVICEWSENGYRDWETDRKSTRLNSSHSAKSRMPSSA